MKKTGKIALILLVAGMLLSCYIYSSVVKKQEADSAFSGQPVTPQATKTPDTAPPYLRIEGKLYWVENIMETEAVFEETDYVGSVERVVAYNKAPLEEWESNCLPEGTLIYRHKELKDVFICLVYDEKTEEYSYYQAFLR